MAFGSKIASNDYTFIVEKRGPELAQIWGLLITNLSNVAACEPLEAMKSLTFAMWQPEHTKETRTSRLRRGRSAPQRWACKQVQFLLRGTKRATPHLAVSTGWHRAHSKTWSSWGGTSMDGRQRCELWPASGKLALVKHKEDISPNETLNQQCKKKHLHVHTTWT